MTMLQCTAAKARPPSPVRESNSHVGLPFRGPLSGLLYCEVSDGRYKCEVRTITSYISPKGNFVKNQRTTRCKPDSDVLHRRCCGAKMQDALRPLYGWEADDYGATAGPAMRFSDLEAGTPLRSSQRCSSSGFVIWRRRNRLRARFTPCPPRLNNCLTESGKGLRAVFCALLDWTNYSGPNLSIANPDA